MTDILQKIAPFWKSIVLSTKESIEEQSNTIGDPGQVRFNNSTFKFEGCHNGTSGVLYGQIWRPLTQDVATSSNLGIIRIGNNLTIDSNGILASIATGESRFKQLVITVSPFNGVADYNSINTAITHAIGTPAGGYIDGSLTSNIGGTGIISPPSPTYPFVIQLGPGQYSEPLNQIVLPDYVSLRGEDNYNSVITQYTGNSTITNGSMIVLGQNCELRNLVVKLDDTSSSAISNSIYSLNKSNVVIDNCIFTCNSTINTTGNTYSIYMKGGNTNSITNSEFLVNAPLLTGNYNNIYIENTTPRIINNKIDILTPLTTSTTGITLVDCIGTESIIDKTYIENITLSNNYSNTVNSSGTNIGIELNNSPIEIKNSEIEVANDPTLSTNYGLLFNSTTALVETPPNNVTIFVNSGTVSTIVSSNTGVINFNTLMFQRGQYISISGSSTNDGIYKIGSVIANTITLESGFNLKTENSGNTITIKALYTADILQTKINGSTNSIKNDDSNTNYYFNLYNVINNGLTNSIGPSTTVYTGYKLITVGSQNCDFYSITDALSSITNNSASNRYKILVNPGTYIESDSIVCKDYVDIEGSNKKNTFIIVNKFLATPGFPDETCASIVMANGMKLSELTITNSFQSSGSNVRSCVIAATNLTQEIILDNIDINFDGYVNKFNAVYINNTQFIFNNINISVLPLATAPTNDYIGIYMNNATSTIYNPHINIVNSVSNARNVGMFFVDSTSKVYNSNITVNSSLIYNYGVYTENINNVSKLIEFYDGDIFTDVGAALDISVYADDYYTIVCNNLNLKGETFTSPLSSRIITNGCFTFTTNQYNSSFQSLNSRGQNEQAVGTITIGDSAGKLNATGTNNLIVGVDAGNSVTSASYSTFLGSNSGKQATTAVNNTLIGSNTGKAITTGNYNTINGSNAGVTMTTANNNVLNGYNSGRAITVGSDNTLIGTNSGSHLTSGNKNVFVGELSGVNTVTANTNVFIGNSSGSSNQSGNDNTYIGYLTGNSSINSNNNVLIGSQSGYTNLASEIVAVGNFAGYNNTNSIKNTYLGTNSGINNTTGECNTYLGSNTGYSASSSSASFNTVIGNEAGHSLTSGARNTLIGSTTSSNGISNDAAGWSLSSGSDNINIGNNAGPNATTASNNVLVGSSIGTAITSANNNIFIGKDTGNAVNTIGQNVIIGVNSGNDTNSGDAFIVGNNAGVGYTGNKAFTVGNNSGKNIQGGFNTFIGYYSGGSASVTTGTHNLAIGPYTGYSITTGTRNIIVGSGDSGSSAGKVITSGSDNTLLGYNTGNAMQTGIGNTLIGSNSGANLTSGANNLILGHNSAYNLSVGSNNVVVGPESGYNLNNGSYNIFSGYQAGYSSTNGTYNINIGYQTGYQSIVNQNNIHIGYQSGYTSIADNNLFLGYQSGLKNTTGTNNIFFGTSSGAGNNVNNRQIGDNNIFVGNETGNANDSGTENIYMGSNSGKNSISGSKNVFIGENTGLNGNTSHNIFVGTTSQPGKGVGYNTDGIGQYNVFMGHDVGIENTFGSENIFLGDKAGRDNTTGIQNIYIGTSAGQLANTGAANNNIAIGSSAGINNLSGTENILIGKEVASLNTNGAYNNNIIIGSEAGKNIQQNEQIFIGSNAGQKNTTGNRNIFIGKNTGFENLISDDNVVIGSDAGSSLSGTGTIGANTIVGSNAGKALTFGTNNIFLGSNSGASATTSLNNVVIGANSMSSGNADNVIIIGNNAGKNNSADNNIFVGSNAGITNTTGSGNISIGKEALNNNINGNYNLSIGYNAGYNNLSNTNIFMGYLSGYTNTTGYENIFMGYLTGEKNTTAYQNIFIGSNAGNKNTIGRFNLFFGANAGQKNTTGENNLIMGVNAGYNNTIGGNNLFLGSNAGFKNITGVNSICMGQSANCGTTGVSNINIGLGSGFDMTGYNTNNICIGELTGRNLQGVNANLFIGTNSGTSTTTGGNNLFIGDRAGEKNTTGSNNVCIGYFSGGKNTTGYYNIFIGTLAGYNCTVTQFHICIGNFAGFSLNAFSYSNLFMGYNSGAETTSGQTNIFLGTDSGHFNTTGSNNICIGRAAGYTSSTGDNNVFIGDRTGSINETGTKNTFIGTNAGGVSKGSNNTYFGCFTGQANNGDNNFFLGYETNSNHPSNTVTSTFSNKFAIYQSAGIGITSNTTAGVCNILLGGDFSTGTLGVGTIVPDSFIGSPISETATKLVVLGNVLANSYTPFTGSHIINLDNIVIINELIEGMIMSSTGIVNYRDINNTIVTVIPSSKINDKSVYGVYCGNETVLDSNTNISKTVYYVNSLGEGGILVSNYRGEIQNGDYITTCPISGYGSLQSDDFLHSYTVAKCTQNIDWSSITNTITYNSVAYKYTTVACTYHCG